MTVTTNRRRLRSNVEIVTDKGQLEEYADEVVHQGEFAFDVETLPGPGETYDDFRLDPRRNIVVWTGIVTNGLSFVVPMGHPVGRQIGVKLEPRVGSDGKTRNFKVPDWSKPPTQLRPSVVSNALEPIFFDEDVLKIGHNVKFDLESWQKYYGNDVIPPPYFDTQIAAFMINENHHDYRLGPVLKREFGIVYDKTLGERIERYPYEDAARYNHWDTKGTWMLKQRYAPEIERQGLDGIWALEMDILEVLLYMERTGALLDVEAAEELFAELTRERNAIRGTLFRLAGGKEVNFNSNPQMQALLYGPRKSGGFGLKPKMKTRGGAPSTSKDALAFHVDHPFVEKYLELQEVDKIWGTYLKAYLGGETERNTGGKKKIEVKPSILVEDADGGMRIHASFKQHGAVTGRFSCSEPNLQNIPRPDTELGKQVRGLFIAPKGHRLVVADYSQIEYVVMAHFSHDPVLVKAFTTGVDLHQLVAGMVFGIDPADVTKVQRTTAKNTNFAVAYGAGDDKVAAMSKISLDEAVKFRKAHRKMLPKLYRWTDSVIVDCRRRRPPHVTTLLGRKRRLPTILSQSWGLRSEAERQAVNTVVQGSAADIIKLAMVRLHSYCDDEMQLSLSVHDELVLICPEDRVDEGQEVMREAMLGDGIQRLLSVPMNIDMKVVDRWAEAK